MPAYIVDVTVDSDETCPDWDGPGTFYYRSDGSQALVLTEVEDPTLTPAFVDAAGMDALIASGEWDLPAAPEPVLGETSDIVREAEPEP